MAATLQLRKSALKSVANYSATTAFLLPKSAVISRKCGSGSGALLGLRHQSTLHSLLNHSPSFRAALVSGAQQLRPLANQSATAQSSSSTEKEQRRQEEEEVKARIVDIKPHVKKRGWIFERQLSLEQLRRLDIGVVEHRKPASVADHVAFLIVRLLRIPVHLFFRERYLHHAVTLETIAAVPGMVGGLLRHLKSLRWMRHDGGWIQHQLEEAENERMHLLTWMEVCQPTLLERMLVLATQAVFYNLFFFLYLCSPRLAHRLVGYLEEEAVDAYTNLIESLESGKIPNRPAPQIAIDYWNLPKQATVLDVAYCVRVDEASHRDVNHHFADRLYRHVEDLHKGVGEKGAGKDS